MAVASVAALQAKKLMRLTISLFGRRFNSSKCKTAAKMTVARIKLLRNKRQAVVKQMRRDIALLLQSGQDATARVRVEHVLREQNILAANEFIELFCELIVARLQIISKQRECPADLKEGISSLIFASPRSSEIPELAAIRKLFEKKYGKDFVSAAIELRPNCGVNRMLIDKLSVRTPSGETKLKVLKEIAKEYQIKWDTTESEQELLRPPEEKIEGPQKFVSATSFPVKPMDAKSVNPNEHSARSKGGNKETSPYEDSASAAKAAADSAWQAVAAAQAAAYLANKEPNEATHVHRSPASFAQNVFSSFSHNQEASSGHLNYENHANNEERRYSPHTETGGAYRRHSYNSVGFVHPESKFDDEVSVEKFRFSGDDDLLSTHVGAGKMHRRHSYNAPSRRPDKKFDESDYEEDEEAEDSSGKARPPRAPTPPLAPSSVTQDSVPHVHPKLPDYDDLAARFEALKYWK
ncbi:IST1-like protein [Rhodamnia argentea]|uniref:IST1-like protein n=1 Tax=Rhodamnia argentea TaxID=178133 RepID=A0A8B8NNU3_9MYRT|nr:IST1-like protein [Rhodamnia argentea]